MSKLKNTKKGMAKKALSVSLVAAMLATSNVPVWAAEDLFSDGEAAVEAPAPVDNDTEVFSEFAADTVDETASKETASSNAYKGTINFTDNNGNAINDDSIEWDSNNTIQANISVKDSNDQDVRGNVYYAWKINDLAPEYDNFFSWNGTSAIVSDTIGEEYAGKTISLMLAIKDGEGKVVWTCDSKSISIKKKNIADYVKVNSDNMPSVEYNGEAHDNEKDSVPTNLLMLMNGGGDGNLTDESKYNVAYTGKDFVNVTDEGITVTLTPNATKLPGYTGELTYTYKITPKQLTSYSNDMVATLVNTSYAYTGNAITKIKATDIKLTDKKTNADLSGYLNVDKDGFVGISTETLTVGGNEKTLWIDLIKGTPETGNRNYDITPDDQSARRIQTANEMKVVARDLSTVTVTIDPQNYTGRKVVIDPSSVKFVDTATGEKLNLGNDVEISVPDNAINSGNGYIATITKKDDNENVKGTVTGEFSIYSANINNAYFENVSAANVPDKDYTGEQITFTSKELGRLVIKKNGSNVAEPLEEGKDYVITYGANVNAGDKVGQIIVEGRGSFLGSKKILNFTIKPASLDSAKSNEFVEIINTQKASDYKTAMGVVVKAKNDSGKEFTLVEGTDYVVQYAFDDGKASNNIVGKDITATVTIVNPNFKGSSTTKTTTSKITAASLKDEYIKLRENTFTYTGNAIEPDFDVVIGGKVINPDYYTATYTNNIYAGTATLSVTGNGTNYSDKVSAKVTFTINPAKTEDLVAVLPSKQYRGYSLEVPASEIYLTLNGNPVDTANNFTLTYGENLNIGDGTVTLTPKNGNFTGTKTLTFKIVGELLAGGELHFYDENNVAISDKDNVFSYDGTAHTFAKTIFDTQNTDYVDYDGKTFSKKLVEGTDYEIKYVDNVYGKKYGQQQKGAVLVIAKGVYGGGFNNSGMNIENGVYTDADGNKISNVIYAEQFEIAQQRVSTTNITVANGVYAGGLPVKPEVNIVVKGVTLVEGKDYDLEYSRRQDRTNATAGKTLDVTIVPKNGYTSRYNFDYKWGIDKFNLADAEVAVQDGKVVVKCGKVDVEASEYTTTTNAADGTTTITAVATSKNYTGSKTFTTNGKTDYEKPATPMLVDVQVVGNKATAVLSGESDGATGYDYVISKDRDCITNKDYDKVNKNILTTKTTFTYTQQGTYYAYCHAWKRVNGVKVFSDWSNAYPFVVTSITPEQPGIQSVKVSGSTVTVTYTKCANATGYDVVLGSAMKKVNGENRPVEYGTLVKKITKGNTVTATFKNVKKGTYYAGLHAYNRTSEDGKKVFSPWSNAKKVTVK